MYERPMRPDELYHYGVKGMHWGVRRYQNKDGTLTSAGKKHYSTGEEKQKKKGLSDSQKSMLKKAAIGGLAVGGAVAAGLALRCYGEQYADPILRAGTSIQTLTEDKERLNQGKQWFATFKASDKVLYDGTFSKKGTRDKLEYKAKENVRIASRQNAKKVFDDLYKSDDEFKKVADLGNNLRKAKQRRNLEKGYDRFNYGIVPKGGFETTDSEHRQQMKGYVSQQDIDNALDKFYGKLKDKGYSGIVDVNDSQASFNVRGSKPIILFDREKIDVSKVKIHDITKTEWAVKRPFAMGIAEKNKKLDAIQNDPKVAIGTAAVVGMGIGAMSEVSSNYDVKIVKKKPKKQPVKKTKKRR